MRLEPPKLPAQLPELVAPEAGQAIENAEVPGLTWPGVETKRPSFDVVVLKNPDFTSASLRNGGWADVRIDGGTMAGANLTGSTLRRVELSKTRASGLVLSETQGKDIRATDSKLDLANFRFAKWSHGQFTRCSFNEADFAGAHLSDISFTDCDLSGCDFSGALLTRVDLRSSTLGDLKGLTGLKGAIIDSTQLMLLSPSLADALGIQVSNS